MTPMKIMMTHLLKPLLRTTMSLVHMTHHNNLSTLSKVNRFYKNVSIIRSNSDYFEIILDQRKLKTPKGNVFYVPNESLAVMIAAEWDSQKDKLHLNDMHLTTLANTVIDNPGNLNSDSIVEKMISYLEGDTLSYRMPEPEELNQLQQTHWDPVVQWFADQYRCSVAVSQNVTLPPIDSKTRDNLSRYLNSFNFWSLTGFLFATESLKSLILACALINKELSVSDAVRLSRIEEDFQAGRWGSVEFHHDLEKCVLETRIAAAVLFTLLNCEKSSISHKQ